MGRKGMTRVDSQTVHKTCDIVAQKDSLILSNCHGHRQIDTRKAYLFQATKQGHETARHTSQATPETSALHTS